MKKILIIDGNSFIFRAFYATFYSGSVMKTKDNIPTNALYGYINFIESIINTSQSDYVFVALDKGSNTFRKKLYSEYKSQRDKAPSELKVQFSLVREYMNKRNIRWVEHDEYEADDIVGSLANKYKSDYIIDIYTGDRDYLQLVDDNVTISMIKKGGLSEVVKYNKQLVFDEYGVDPVTFIDLKAIVGDKSDNIPGVSGIGEKGALKYLQKYKNLEEIYENIHNEKQNKTTEKFINDEENAKLSKVLSEIKTDISDINFELDSMIMDLNYDEEYVSFLEKYELNSIIKRLGKTTNKKENIEKIVFLDKFDNLNNPIIEIVTSVEDSYHFNTIEYLSIKESDNYYFFDKKDITKDLISKIFESNPILFDYKKYKTIIMNCFDITIDFKTDVMLKGYVVDSENTFSKIEKYSSIFDFELNSNKDLFKLFKKNEDIAIFRNELYNRLNLIEQMNIEYDKEIKRQELDNILTLENNVSNVLWRMENNGICFNEKTNEIMMDDVDKRLDILESDIHNLAGEEFNVKSPKQLGIILFEKLEIKTKKKTKTKTYSTSVDVLESLLGIHPIIEKILEYRTLSKLSTTYLHAFNKFVKEDNKIHTIYNQVGTTTGRLSSNYPNLQNIPSRFDLGRRVRKSFEPRQGYNLVAIDYSQIELRIIASIANEENMIESFNNGFDIHSDTASKVFGVSIEDIDTNQRKMAKAINFGILYGMGAFKLATDLGISRKDAQDFIEKYLSTYPNIENYIEDQKKFASLNEYVTTILNRKRYVRNINDSNKMIQSLNQRIAVNSPIQGSASEILKIAMVELDKYIINENVDAQMILQIHDELVFEVSKINCDQIIHKFIQIMENIYELKVKLECNYKLGDNWYDMK